MGRGWGRDSFALTALKSLRDLLGPAAPEIEVSAITDRLEEVKPGVVFFAIQGSQQDGHLLVDKVIAQGASWIVSEKSLDPIPHLRVENTRDSYARACDYWFDSPSRKLKIIATTGTSGKTTTTYLLHALLKASGKSTGMLSTIENRIGSQVLESTLTTPGPKELQSMLANMVASGNEAVAMEASSHAIDQRRIAGIMFDSLVFTNLSPEHLDYHADLEAYFTAKAELFRSFLDDSLIAKKTVVALPTQGEYGKRLLLELRSKSVPVTLYGEAAEAQAEDGEYFVELKEAFYSMRGIRAEFIWGLKGGMFEAFSVESPLIGEFNAQNICAAIAGARPWLENAQMIIQGISAVSRVPGRLEKVVTVKDRHIFVDYAHKPAALEIVLKTLKDLESNCRRITVFGCGGDRDPYKRPLMGEIAARLSDEVWITTDNSRREDPLQIIRAIQEGIPSKYRQKVHIEPDRRQAIQNAVAAAPPNSCILIAGKGHEKYQIVGEVKYPFSDTKEAIQAAARLDSEN